MDASPSSSCDILMRHQADKMYQHSYYPSCHTMMRPRAAKQHTYFLFPKMSIPMSLTLGMARVNNLDARSTILLSLSPC